LATGVVDTGGNMPPVPNLPLVSTTPALAKFAAGVVDLVANLPSVSLTPVVHLRL
jgi:hypothetical protein